MLNATNKVSIEIRQCPVCSYPKLNKYGNYDKNIKKCIDCGFMYSKLDNANSNYSIIDHTLLTNN